MNIQSNYYKYAYYATTGILYTSVDCGANK